MTIQQCLRSADDFSLVAYELGADMARQNIRYREATVTPYTHLIQNKGLAARTSSLPAEEKRRGEAEFMEQFERPRSTAS